MKKIIILVFVLYTSLFTFYSFAQSWQPLQGGLDYIARTLYPDLLTGKLFVGGDFNYVGPVTGYSAAIDTTGLFDSGMPRINDTVSCVIPDG